MVEKKTNSNALIDVLWYSKEEDPIICGINGNFCDLEAIERELLGEPECRDEKFVHGLGAYLFEATYEEPQIDDMGRTELAGGWHFEFKSFKSLDLDNA